MKIAIPQWNGRVSPVFDVAGNVLIVEVGAGGESREEIVLDADDPFARCGQLAGAGVDVLICGAISRPVERAIAAAGVEVIPQICGEIDVVLAAFLAGTLDGGAFLMPGCCGRRRRRNRRGRGCGRRDRNESTLTTEEGA